MSATTPKQSIKPSSSSLSSPSSTTAPNLVDSSTYLNDLPLLTPSKPPTSVSDSESDSIPERFTDEDEESQPPADLMHSIHLDPDPTSDHQRVNPEPQRTPSSQTSLSAISNNQISLSEPVPIRNNKINRKRSLSALVALRYRGGKADSEIGDEERGLLALDLDTYINSGEPECIPETRALPPSALFPTLSTVLQTTSTTNESQRRTGGVNKKEVRISESKLRKEVTSEVIQTKNNAVELDSDGLLLPTPRSEWPFGGGTGPGKTSRGFIPGRSAQDLESILNPSPLLVPLPPRPELISSEAVSTPTLD